MKILKIEKLKNGKYKIIIDQEEIITYDDVILENDLLYKKSIEKDEYLKVIHDNTFFDVYNRTLKYILKKRRSIKETYKYLEKYNISMEEKTKIIEKLKSLKILDDVLFCKAFINDKVYLSKCGINKIKNDLMEQDISLDIIDRELAQIDTSMLNSRLEKIIIKKINCNKKYSNYILKQKILNDLISLGYDKETVLNIIDSNLDNEDNSDILSNEFNKIYFDLAKKYKGDVLKNKVIQKLVLKGFKLFEIKQMLYKKKEE